MAYVDAQYYSLLYYGISVESDFDRLAKRASDDVDIACNYGIVLDDLSPQQLGQLKNAVAAQIEYYVVNGDEYNNSAAGGSVSVGSYSESAGNGQRSPAALCPRAMAYLEQTGLIFRGAEVLR